MEPWLARYSGSSVMMRSARSSLALCAATYLEPRTLVIVEYLRDDTRRDSMAVASDRGTVTWDDPPLGECCVGGGAAVGTGARC